MANPKQGGVNPLVLNQVNKDGNSGIINQEIYTKRSPNMDYNQGLDRVKYATIELWTLV